MLEPRKGWLLYGHPTGMGILTMLTGVPVTGLCLHSGIGARRTRLSGADSKNPYNKHATIAA